MCFSVPSSSNGSNDSEYPYSDETQGASNSVGHGKIVVINWLSNGSGVRHHNFPTHHNIKTSPVCNSFLNTV